MPKRSYKGYLHSDSAAKIPRSTLSTWRKLERDKKQDLELKNSAEQLSDRQDKKIQSPLKVDNIYGHGPNLSLYPSNQQNKDLSYSHNNNGSETTNISSESIHIHDEEESDSEFWLSEADDLDGVLSNNEEENVDVLSSRDKNFYNSLNCEDQSEAFNESDGVNQNKDDQQDQSASSQPEYSSMLNRVLCACSDITVGEVLLMVMSIGLKYCLPWVVLVQILKMVNVLYGNKYVPDSKFFLHKYFPPHMEKSKYHLYCPNCKAYLGQRDKNIKDIICACGVNIDTRTTRTYFIEFDLESQLKNLFSNSTIIDGMLNQLNQRKANNFAMEDIYDGKAYKRYVKSGLLDDWRNFSCIFNTDGCRLATSGKYSIWPIYIKINELPLHLRNKYILLAGLWVDKTEPDMNLYLKPFVNQANKLMSTGFKWILNGENITSKLFFICNSVDSPCRAAILSMKSHSGYYGCTYCHHPAQNIDNTRKFPISITVPKRRTDAEVKQTMVQLQLNPTGTDGQGVLGPTVLMNLQNFDLIVGSPPDYMHGGLLGAARQYTDTILTSVGKDYYVGSPAQLVLIDKRLTSFATPDCIHRTPRTINEYKLWKASEWLSWLLFYSLVCLQGILPSKYLAHWSKLVAALNILLNDSVTTDSLQYARKLIIEFVATFQTYYGIEAMTYNMHLLLHLCDAVDNWGPLWTCNTFVFENQNRLLLKLKQSPAHIATQIGRRLLSFQNLFSYSETIKISATVDAFCQSLTKKSFKTYSKFQNHVLIGSGKLYKLNVEEKSCLSHLNSPIIKSFSFSQIIENKIRYTTQSYQENYCKNINNSVVLLENGTIGIISNICRISTEDATETVIFVQEMLEKKPYSLKHFVTPIQHIKEYQLTDKLKAYTPCQLKNKCLFMTVEKKHYIAKIPKGCKED